MAYGGYEYDFVADPVPDRLICEICLLPSKDPQSTQNCGHLFCRCCLDQSLDTHSAGTNNGGPHGGRCLKCRERLDKWYSAVATNREIQCLHIYCTNRREGCDWSGQVNDIDNHRDGCLFEEVECYACRNTMPRRNLNEHLNTHDRCQYCDRHVDDAVST